jgi:hypothetical protein
VEWGCEFNESLLRKWHLQGFCYLVALVVVILVVPPPEEAVADDDVVVVVGRGGVGRARVGHLQKDPLQQGGSAGVATFNKANQYLK